MSTGHPILDLLADLYRQVQVQQEKVAELEAIIAGQTNEESS